MKVPFFITPYGKLRNKWKPGQPLGWTVKETIGVAIVNPRALAMAKKSVIVGK